MLTNQCGIYKITNIITGDFYIGSSCNIRNRIYHHRWHLNNNKHGNPHLQCAWNKYSKDCFEFSICEYCEKERLLEKEQLYIDNEKPSYNVLRIAGSPLGVKCSEETKRKIGAANKGELSANFGKHLSEETCAKMSEVRKGELHPMFGKHHTEETRHKISESSKGKLVSEEARRNLSKAGKGRHQSDETKRKLSAANIGKHMSEESRRKMSEAQKGNTKCLGYKHTEETRQHMSEAGKRRIADAQMQPRLEMA